MINIKFLIGTMNNTFSKQIQEKQRAISYLFLDHERGSNWNGAPWET
jgi:hypothetical protein